jgi:hypothetical protein
MASNRRFNRRLGTSLSDIVARKAEGAYPSYEGTLFGGAGTATPEEVSSALTYTSPKETGEGGGADGASTEVTELPPPTKVFMVEQAYGLYGRKRKGPKAGDAYKRPDLDKDAYGQGSQKSTRVWAFQWIPTNFYEDGDTAEGDFLVAFARKSNAQSHTLYVYKNIKGGAFDTATSSSGLSLGRWVNRMLGTGFPYTSEDGDSYKELHPTFPADDWIFSTERMALWSSKGRPVAATGSILSVEYLTEVFKSD